MCKVALIDDEKKHYEEYKMILESYDVELLFAEYMPKSTNKSIYSQILDWILKNQIEFVLVDYKLDLKYEFQGSQLIQYLNNNIPDLQCVLFTSNPTDDDLVLEQLKINKNVFSQENKLNEFVKLIKQGANIFHNRIESSLDEYKDLLAKREKDTLSSMEIEQLTMLYKRLISYGLVEELPSIIFKDDIEEKMDKLIEDIEDFLKNDK